jgi:hypothetical protein
MYITHSDPVVTLTQIAYVMTAFVSYGMYATSGTDTHAHCSMLGFRFTQQRCLKLKSFGV